MNQKVRGVVISHNHDQRRAECLFLCATIGPELRRARLNASVEYVNMNRPKITATKML